VELHDNEYSLELHDNKIFVFQINSNSWVSFTFVSEMDSYSPLRQRDCGLDLGRQTFHT